MTYPRTLSTADKEQFDKSCLRLVRSKMARNNIKARLKKHNTNLQRSYGGHGFADTRDFLNEGEIYDVLVEVHDWHTRYYIGDNYYNSVCFEKIKSKPNIEQFVDELSFDLLVILGKALGLPFDHTQWLDDEFPDREGELRVALVERLEEAGGGL